MDPLYIGLLGTKFHKLKYIMHMKVLYGILHGIRWVISSAVEVMITQPSFGVETVQGIQVETNTLAMFKDLVSKPMLSQAVHFRQKVQRLQDHLQQGEPCVLKELFQVLVLQCLSCFQPLI